MPISVRTADRLSQPPKRRRRKKKQPTREVLLRVEWLAWLVEEYGADSVAGWEEAPVSFEEWLRGRKLAAHVAA